MSDLQERVLNRVGKAMGRFAMLRPGERIAVGVSGGKDSVCLLHALAEFRKRAPFPYELIAFTVEQGKFKSPILALEEHIRSLGVEWVRLEDPLTLKLVANKVEHGCDVCSRNRRRSLYKIASSMGCTAVALGHTANDCAESLMRNILFNGRIASLPPVAQSRKGELRVIRPLVYVTEDLSAEYAKLKGFLPINCVCSEKDGVRREIREFLGRLASNHPEVLTSIAGALGNVNPYTLFDPLLRKEGGDISPAFEAAMEQLMAGDGVAEIRAGDES